MTPDQKDIARRWCILNCWGWPSDVDMPADPKERYRKARELMDQCVRHIGRQRCLEYWNSDEFDGTTVKHRYDSEAMNVDDL